MEIGLQSGYVANGGPPPPAGILSVGDVQRTSNRLVIGVKRDNISVSVLSLICIVLLAIINQE